MGKTTDISWCHHTWSPWWGCMKVSPGCQFCYADGLARRWNFAIWGPPATTDRRTFSDKHWHQPEVWNASAGRAGERRRVFPSMCDPFELHPQVTDERARMFDLIRRTPWLDWLLLTKRPELAASMLPPGYLHNVWLGTSTEDQPRADERVPWLLGNRGRAPVLFLSIEPQIGEVTLEPEWLAQLDWAITGGESGPRHRPFDVNWARLTRDQCRAAGVAWHYKQFGGRTHAAGGCLLDGEETKEFPTPHRFDPREVDARGVDA